MTEDDRYSRGKIYKLVSDVTDQIYIGSCCVPLRKRLCIHKGKFNKTKSKELFKLGGKVEIILIEEFPCKSKMELERRERFHIENNDCVNRVLPARTKTELQEYQKKYREINKIMIAERNKEYYEANREALCEYKNANKEKISERKKEWHKINKEKTKEHRSTRVNCPHCSKEMNRSSLHKHIKNIHKIEVS